MGVGPASPLEDLFLCPVDIDKFDVIIKKRNELTQMADHCFLGALSGEPFQLAHRHQGLDVKALFPPGIESHPLLAEAEQENVPHA